MAQIIMRQPQMPAGPRVPAQARREAIGRNPLNARRLEPKPAPSASLFPTGFALDAAKGFGLFRRVLNEGKN